MTLSAQKVGYSMLMDAFAVTNLVFLSIHYRVDDAVVFPPKGGLFDIDGHICGHEVSFPFYP